MTTFSRKSLLLGFTAVLLITAGCWLYLRDPQPVEIANYVPESALGYVEINNLPQLLSQMTATEGWQQLAPAYGLSGKLNFLANVSQVGWLARLTGNNEMAALSGAQAALFVTALEVRGETVKPRFAVILVSQGREGALQKLIDARLPQLAQDIFGQTTVEATEQAGVPVTIHRPAADRQKELVSARVKDVWVLSNNLDSARDCLNTIQERQSPITHNSNLSKARSAVGPNPAAFGFVTGEGVKRLLRFGTYMAAGGVIGKAALAGAVGEVFTNFSGKTCDGIAYGGSFEGGRVVDRYAVLFKPDLAQKLGTLVKTNPTKPRAYGLIPAAAREVTVINVANPARTLDGIEAAVSARVDAAQSFLLHQFIIGMREAAFGAKSLELMGAAVGDEIVSFNLTGEPQDRVWLIAAKDRTVMAQVAETVLKQFQDKRAATVSRETIGGFDLMNSSEQIRGSAAFVGDFLALGRREQLIRLIEAQRDGQKLSAAPQFMVASKGLPDAPLLSFSSVREESGEMMAALSRAFGRAVVPTDVGALNHLPLAASATSVTDEGLYVESRSPFGNFPFFVSLADGSTNRQDTDR